MNDDAESKIVWEAGEEYGRRQERKRIVELLDSLACEQVFCREAKIMQTHSSCRIVREHIKLIEGDKHE
jgi:hypothetical protein